MKIFKVRFENNDNTDEYEESYFDKPEKAQKEADRLMKEKGVAWELKNFRSLVWWGDDPDSTCSLSVHIDEIEVK